MKTNGGALTGLKVVDISRVLGGPYCGQILADHGADVVKVEPPQGDDTREWGPPFKDGISAYFSGLNRNKRSVALDLGSVKGQEVLFRLLEGAAQKVDAHPAVLDAPPGGAHRPDAEADGGNRDVRASELSVLHALPSPKPLSARGRGLLRASISRRRPFGSTLRRPRRSASTRDRCPSRGTRPRRRQAGLPRA